MRRFLKLKLLLMVALIAVAVMAVLPSVMPEDRLPTWLTESFDRRFKLGLDLQGGLHLEYSVAVDEAVENQLDRLSSELEADFKEKKDVTVKIEREGHEVLRIRFADPSQVALATDDVLAVAYELLERADDEDEPGLTEADGVVTLRMPIAKLNETRTVAVANALETVRKRVDAMGVAEPNIYPKNRQIVVELPGLSDSTTEAKAAAADASHRVREILVQDGAPQVVIGEVLGEPWGFKLTVPDANLRELLDASFAGKITDDGRIIDVRLPAELMLVEGGADIVGDVATVTMALTPEARDQVLEDSSDFRRLLKVIERQAVLTMHLVDDETLFRDTGKPYLQALYEANMVRQGMGVSVNIDSSYGRDGGVQVKDPYAFFAKDVETLKRFFDNLPAEWRLPSDLKVAYGPVPQVVRRGEPAVDLYRTYIIKSRADVGGEQIVNATVGFDQQTGSPEVNVKLNRVGANTFEDMSGNNVGRKMAIILDELVRSDPVFNERIPGGNVRITLGGNAGQSSREAANDLVKVLKSGSLPARLQQEFEIRVGADLGRDSVERGFRAFLYGLCGVIVFMLIYYRASGFIAVFALVLNMVLILAAMALFRATLTLPGIAGVVLTIGMAVDANVIIFERIRDYIREGYTARAAIESGYDRAFTTIVDGQLTTAIAGLVLWQYGSGPIRGFAITLLIGIASSIFTAVWCSRVFFDFQANRRGFNRISI